MTAASIQLEPQALLVRYAWTAVLADPERYARALALLDEAERARAARFVFERDRFSYALAHALVRAELARLTGVVPQALRFEAGERGRPELIWPATQPRLRFNLSHTHGLCACAFALERDVGVDVEHADRRVEIDRLAPSVFSEHEITALDQLEQHARRTRFFQLWTLKEAYIKARGMGLALPLREITFQLDGRARPAIALSAAIDDDASRWWFDVRKLGDGHMLAAALAGVPRALDVREHDPTA